MQSSLKFANSEVGDYDGAASQGFRARWAETSVMSKSKAKLNPTVNWTRVMAILGVIGAAFGFLAWYDQFRLPDMISARTANLEQKMAVLDAKLDVFLNSMLRKAASNVGTPDEVKEVSEIIDTAYQRKVVLDPQLVSEVGKAIVRSVETTKENSSDRWQTVMQFVNYQSFLNGKLKQAPDLPPPSEQATLRAYPGESVTVQNYKIENKHIVVDNIRWESVVFINCNITFEGGPTVFKNVYFVNCRFNIPQSPKGIILARSIFDGFPVAEDLWS